MTTLVFLHGFLGSPSEWDPLLNELDASLPTRALALPVGDDWPSGVQQIAAQLPPESVLVGYSLGARLALGVALDSPENLRGLCLVSGNPGLDPTEQSARWTHDESIAARLESEPLSQFLDGWYRQDIFASVDDGTRAAWVHHKQILDPAYQARLLRTYSIARQPNYWPRLDSLQIPTLVVIGQRDPKYSAIGLAMQRQAAQLRLQGVPQVGHAVHREQPAALAKLLQAFIASLPWEETNA